MAQSVVDVCNSALQKLGAGRILSLNDNTRESRSCTIAYDSNRRSELRKYYWNFATKRVVLAPDAQAPAFGYKYAFTLPPDFLRFVLPNDATIDWVKEGNKILTNSLTSPFFTYPTVDGAPMAGLQQSLGSPSMSVRYIADITDVTQWDSAFYDVAAISLAIDLCEDLTQSNQKKQVLMAEYKEAVSEARLADAFENLPANPPDDGWWLARF